MFVYINEPPSELCKYECVFSAQIVGRYIGYSFGYICLVFIGASIVLKHVQTSALSPLLAAHAAAAVAPILARFVFCSGNID